VCLLRVATAPELLLSSCALRALACSLLLLLLLLAQPVCVRARATPRVCGCAAVPGGDHHRARDQDKYRKRRRWRSTARLGAAAASDGKLSLTRIAGMLCALTVLSCFFLWLFAVRDEEVMERIREHTGGLHAHAVARGPGPGGGGALSSTGGSSSL